MDMFLLLLLLLFLYRLFIFNIGPLFVHGECPHKRVPAAPHRPVSGAARRPQPGELDAGGGGASCRGSRHERLQQWQRLRMPEAELPTHAVSACWPVSAGAGRVGMAQAGVVQR